ncbi:hypothetical protein JCM16303_001281 [Sporobolomyces ruberrimus]
MPDALEPIPSDDDSHPFPTEPSLRMEISIAALLCAVTAESTSPSLASAGPVQALLTSFPDGFVDGIKAALPHDTLGRKVLLDVASFPSFALLNGLLFVHDSAGLRLVIPKGKVSNPDPDGPVPTLIEETIRPGHLIVGHMGAAKTLAYLRRFFWWSQMHRDVFDYCHACETCSRNKSSSTRPFGRLHPLPTPDRPFSVVSMDFVVSLPSVTLNGTSVDSILTVTCLLSKLVVLIPLPSTASAPDVASSLFTNFYRRFGLPSSIVSDRDPKFTSSFWRALCDKIGIKLKMSTAAHPETDGRSEVTNKIVGSMLRCYCEDSPLEWAERLTDIEFAINSAPSSATSLSPFEIVFGFLPSPYPVDSWSSTTDATVEERMDSIRLVWLRATDALITSRVDMVHEENKHRRLDDPSIFDVGKKAYLSSAGLRFPHALSGKFIPKFLGPFSILSANHSTSNYTLALPPHLRIHNKFHASKLRPHFPNDDARFPSRSLSLPPPIVPAVNGAEEEYVIEKIVEDKVVRNKAQYKVRYEGYSAADDQFQSEAELRSAGVFQEIERLKTEFILYYQLVYVKAFPKRVSSAVVAQLAELDRNGKTPAEKVVLGPNPCAEVEATQNLVNQLFHVCSSFLTFKLNQTLQGPNARPVKARTRGGWTGTLGYITISLLKAQED